MKYRIKEKNGKFYPQYKAGYNLYFWANFTEKWSVVHPTAPGDRVVIYSNESFTNMYCNTLEEADAYLAKKKKENEVNIYVR